MTKRLFTALFFAALVAIPAFANVVVGNPPDPGEGNCFPFGCAYSVAEGPEYQQVYNASQFTTGTINISDLEFFNTQVNDGATAMNGGTFTISLCTTSENWNSLSSSYATNLGSCSGGPKQVFSGSLAQPWAFGDTLTIVLATNFVYNPSAGNLLMDVTVSNSSDANGEIFFDTNGFDNGNLDGNNFLGRVYDGGSINNGYGLVTGFSTSPLAGTPEPSTLFLLGTGLGLMGIFKARRSRRVQG